jgi:hypothetical protein
MEISFAELKQSRRRKKISEPDIEITKTEKQKGKKIGRK